MKQVMIFLFTPSEVNVGEAYDGANSGFVVGQGEKGPGAKEVKVINDS